MSLCKYTAVCIGLPSLFTRIQLRLCQFSESMPHYGDIINPGHTHYLPIWAPWCMWLPALFLLWQQCLNLPLFFLLNVCSLKALLIHDIILERTLDFLCLTDSTGNQQERFILVQLVLGLSPPRKPPPAFYWSSLNCWPLSVLCPRLLSYLGILTSMRTLAAVPSLWIITASYHCRTASTFNNMYSTQRMPKGTPCTWCAVLAQLPISIS